MMESYFRSLVIVNKYINQLWFSSHICLKKLCRLFDKKYILIKIKNDECQKK